jgi:uncharacterized protein YdiU (UPF0061 family)
MPTIPWRFSHSYAALPAVLFADVTPTPVADPRMVVFNHELAEQVLQLGLAEPAEQYAAELSGTLMPAGARPLAQAYAGHQFGHFTMLGDGRAILLGEHSGRAGSSFDIQLKGAGRTPYSRGGDGRAALAPMLREFIISEGLAALGVPTTRSLAVVATGEGVVRRQVEPGAVLTRVARSHCRVGTFEFAAQQRGSAALQALVDHCITRLYPHLCAPPFSAEPFPALRLLEGVIERQAALIAQWQSLGFIHGVMNTDNMAISGESIDFGPCAWMDYFDPGTVYSSIDQLGRYAYRNQPAIALWNLTRFAEAVLPLLGPDEPAAIQSATAALGHFEGLYRNAYRTRMAAKLGLHGVRPEDDQLVARFLAILERRALDYTTSFRELAGELSPPRDPAPKGSEEGDGEYTEWLRAWRQRVGEVPLEQTQAVLRSSNPCIVPRNHQVERVLAAAHAGDLSPLHELLSAIRSPYCTDDTASGCLGSAGGCSERCAAGTPWRAQYVQPPSREFARSYATFCGT